MSQPLQRKRKYYYETDHATAPPPKKCKKCETTPKCRTTFDVFALVSQLKSWETLSSDEFFDRRWQLLNIFEEEDNRRRRCVNGQFSRRGKKNLDLYSHYLSYHPTIAVLQGFTDRKYYAFSLFWTRELQRLSDIKRQVLRGAGELLQDKELSDARRRMKIAQLLPQLKALIQNEPWAIEARRAKANGHIETWKAKARQQIKIWEAEGREAEIAEKQKIRLYVEEHRDYKQQVLLEAKTVWEDRLHRDAEAGRADDARREAAAFRHAEAREAKARHAELREADALKHRIGTTP